jgi:hypothetical protein
MQNHPNCLLNLSIRKKIMLTVTLDDDVASILNNMAKHSNIHPEKFLNQWIKRTAKVSETPKLEEDDFFSFAGMWEDRNITQEELRASAWKRES